MADREPAGKPPAPVPSLAEPGQQLVGRENDFAHLNKQLRACLVCKLVKATQQVHQSVQTPAAGLCAALDGHPP
jgi:hypothetical protein